MLSNATMNRGIICCFTFAMVEQAVRRTHIDNVFQNQVNADMTLSPLGDYKDVI